MNRLGATPGGQTPVRLNVAKVHVPLSAVLAASAERGLAAGGWWLLRHPFTVAGAVVVLLASRITITHGPLPVLVMLAVVAVVLLAWRIIDVSSFTRLVLCRARGAWRAATVYRYLWQPAMVTTAMAVRVDGMQYLPRPRLAQTFGVLDCRVRTVPCRAHHLALWCLRSDPHSPPR